MSARTIPRFHATTHRPVPPSAGRVTASPSGPDQLSAVVAADLARSGKWATWCSCEPRLDGVACLEDAIEGWQSRRDPRSYQLVAALTALGSRRGGDDDDAALAVVVLLGPGIARLAATLRDVCEVDDVRATLWEEVKRAEPQLGNLAARYLLQRARQRLTRPAAGMVARGETVSLDQQLGWDGATRSGLKVREEHDRDLMVAAPGVEDPVRDLADLLTWAREVGVIEAGEVDLIVELLAAANDGAATEDAQRLVGERHGVAMRTIRRRRDATLARLRAAAPDYLAATA
jgi:hypothetical protein